MAEDSYGASLSFAASSGASNSGATDSSGGGVYGSTTYGPGSVVVSPAQSGASISSAALGLSIGAALLFVWLNGRGKG